MTDTILLMVVLLVLVGAFATDWRYTLVAITVAGVFFALLGAYAYALIVYVAPFIRGMF